MQSCLRPQGLFDDSACSVKENLICSNKGAFAGRCICADNFYFDSTQQTCEAMKTASLQCKSSEECRQDLGLYCSVDYGLCFCKPRFYWNEAFICLPLSKLGENCPSPQCDFSLLLTCNLASKMCECQTGYFWFNDNCSIFWLYY